MRWIGMKPALSVLLAIMTLAATVGAIEVDREELEDSITGDVEFINYEGPAPELPDSLEDIRGIGRVLAVEDLEPGGSASYFDRYRVVHAVDPDVPTGLDADVFIILDGGRVDHIDNVRRILAAYLIAAYDYEEPDAATLARFITVYNAIYRGDMEFFRGRYKTVVTQHISEENAGISTLYSDWPGRTRMLVPLTPDAAPGELGAVDALQLTEEDVIEMLREQEDRGIEERRDMVDLMEREADEREERAEEERERIAEEREEVEEEQERLEEEREETEEERERTPPEDEEAREELDSREEELDEEEEELAEDSRELEDREREAEEEEDRAEELRERSREERDRIAEDTREELDEDEEQPAERRPQPLFFIKVRYADGNPVGRPVILDRRTGEEIRRSEVREVTSRGYDLLDGDALVVAEHEGRSRLVLVDGEDLEVVARSGTRVHPRSLIVVRGRGEIYAVAEIEDSWRLGRFDGALSLRAYSAETVEPATSIEIADDRIYVQNRRGRIMDLAVDGLEEGPED
ncbi:MAG: P83/100 family protein [Spirochaetaceae bacterium]